MVRVALNPAFVGHDARADITRASGYLTLRGRAGNPFD